MTKAELVEGNYKVADHYGYEAQSNQLVEECAELIQAVNKYRRAHGAGQETTVKVAEARANLIEELADVEVMIEQVRYLLSISEEEILKVREHKLLRTFERMQK